MTDLFDHTDTGATFSPCRRYRYSLWRQWSSGPSALWLMLNPSTADETANDPTVERCQRRAVAAGYGILVVCNIFALRSTDPKALYSAANPVGPQNDHRILAQAQHADQVICGWGNHGRLMNRGRVVLGKLRQAGITPHCLRMTGAGEPGHPLYLPYSIEPMAMEVAV